MTLETSRVDSRRAILAGALGAVVATIATAVGRPNPAAATNGEFVKLGTFASDTDGTGPNAASSTTKIITSAGIGLAAESATGYGLQGISNSNYGVRGSSSASSGIYGVSTSGYGVYATSTLGSAIGAYSPNAVAVNASSASTDKAAIRGQSNGNMTAVLGFSGPAAGPQAVDRTGVYGVANQDDGAVGVRGDSPIGGAGVIGFSGPGEVTKRPNTGVYGQSNMGGTGVGVRGHSGGGTGGYFSSTTGTSLRATGRVRLDRSAGIATVAEGATNVLVTPGIDVTATSAVVATVMSTVATTIIVRRVAPDPTANTFRIHVSAAAPAGGLKVAWHVFG